MGLKWNCEGVNFSRGNHEPLIAKFDNSKVWLNPTSMMTTQAFKSSIRRLAQAYGANSVTVKPFFSDNGVQTETQLVDYINLSPGYKFRNELSVKEGERRQFRYYEESEIFFPI
jgi:hypothetical protein